jgi:uncharacterized protein (DUF362 family)
MSLEITRREVLIGGLGAVGLAVAGPLLRPAEMLAAAPLDRSADAPTAPVAIQRCESYDPAVVIARMKAALDLIGGLGTLVRGKTVTIKLNLTGVAKTVLGKPASRTYHVHPAVVTSLVTELAAAGATRINIIESWYYEEPMEEALAKACGWDIPAVKAAGGQKVFFESTRNRGSGAAYSRLKVPWGGYLWPAFDVNSLYEKTDVYISLAKLKDHSAAGVTMVCKNNFGIMPSSLYGDDAPNEKSTSARVRIIHDGGDPPDGVPAELKTTAAAPADWKKWKWRVARTVADTVGARPIDLAVIDAVESMSGGEGFWNEDLAVVEPKLLIVGRNPVCTDAVSAAVMGYDPQAAHAQFPFPGENHLRLLAQAGVGTIDLKRIEVLGLPVAKALCRYRTEPKDGAKTAWHPASPASAMQAFAAACAHSRLA